MQAILNGTPYPVTLINVVERRINVERDVPPDKAAIIKAYYLRKTTNDRSAARGNMAVRKLYVFKHSSALGDAPSWKLFDSINVHKRDGADVARNFSDYEVQVNREAIPDSVSVSEMVDHTL